MMISESIYVIKTTSRFDKKIKSIVKQNKSINKLEETIYKLANNIELDEKYNNHKLKDDKYYKNCYECHIEPDWLLIYKKDYNQLILLLFDTGSHSDLFK